MNENGRNHIDIKTTYDLGVLIQYVVIPQYGPLSQHVELEGPSIVKLDFFFPRYSLWILSRALGFSWSPRWLLVYEVGVKWPSHGGFSVLKS